MKLSIIIINYNCSDILDRCLNSIQYDKPYEVIIIDNDGTLKHRKFKQKNISVVPYTRNLGFAKANNIAIGKAKGEYILTLNADAFLTKSYIKACIQFLEKEPHYSSVQGKLLFYYKKNHIDSTGHILSFYRFAKNENQYTPDRYTISKEVFGVCAAAAVYRRSALERIKINNEYFDSDFFAYLEDVDLDWRMKIAGYKAYFINKALSYHIRELTTNAAYRLKLSIRNRLFMIIKNDSILSVIINIIAYLPFFFFLPDLKSNLRKMMAMFRKRKLVQSKRNIPHRKIAEWFENTNILEPFYILKLLLLSYRK